MGMRMGLNIFLILPISPLGLVCSMWISWVENVVNIIVCLII